ncbi:MAG: NADH-quinone oxidoreductase subunit J [Armatimonadota bacterium]|nr:NADH-quinone oxidoreductase subunit J [Armatimonadota bacterium]MDR7403715.1 NADH-quinone oxidoreductase subunit J [Armatimonadota bacterium]
MEVALFSLAAAGALAGGVGVVASRLPVRNVLSLLLVLVCVAVLYLLLAAPFIAVLQVIVYAGAIVVLFLFVVMLLHVRSGEPPPDRLRGQRPLSVLLVASLLAALAAVVRAGPAAPAPAPEDFGTAQAVGRVLFTTYLLAFEVASVILLAGIVAAVVLGRPARPAAGRGEERR